MKINSLRYSTASSEGISPNSTSIGAAVELSGRASNGFAHV
ncbi:MAG TPA: hypothetical protein VFF72_00815 [Caldimonas sp.]|nr:hypothetical protein [Caldimonas sp.]